MPTPREYAARAAAALLEVLHLAPTDRDAKRVARIIAATVTEATLESERSAKLRMAEHDRLARLLSTSPTAIYSFAATADFAPTFVSDNVRRLFGYDPSEYIENPSFWRDRIHPDDLARVEAEISRLFARGLHALEYRFRRRDGTYCWVDDAQQLIRGEDGKPVEIVGSWSDITGRRKPEAAKDAAPARLTQLLTAAPAVIYSFEARGAFAPTFVSQNIKDLLGYAPAEYLESSDFWRRCVHPDDLAAVEAEFVHLFQAGRHTVEYRFLRKNGTYRWVSDEWRLVRDEHGQPIEVVGSWSDITTRKALEDQLRQAQKMEAVGQLTGGIAHDFNNLLTGILGNLDLLGGRVKDEQSLRLVQNAMRSAERGAQLTGQLLAFSRRQHLAPRPIDLNQLVEGMNGMLLSTLGGTIRIETVLRPDLWAALADPTPIELAILNLAINARDAMPIGGTIRVETANATLLRPPERPEEPLPGEYVVVSVKDTGAGMGPKVLARVFEPFFTTKEVGKGSGLGLSQVCGVARQLGGGVRIESRLGEGTSVTIYLPRATAAVPADEEEPRRSSDAGFDGTVVLLADDDPDARSALAAMLEEIGCSVIEAESGAAALRRLADSHHRIDVVLLDFAMPEMNGVEVERRIRAQRPDLPILFVTGYADDSALGAIAGSDRILQKPLRIGDLAAKLARSLPTTPAAQAP